MTSSNFKYLLSVLMLTATFTASAQKVVIKYDAHLKAPKTDVSGILIQLSTDSSNRFVFVTKLGPKLFDIEVGKTDFNYNIRYFSPIFKNEKRLTGIAKELFVLGFDDNAAQEKKSKVTRHKISDGYRKNSFGIFGRRVSVDLLSYHTLLRCKFYPVSFELQIPY